MSKEITALELAHKNALDDLVRLDEEMEIQIANILEGKTITVAGKECILKMGRRCVNHYSRARLTLSVMNSTENLEARIFQIEPRWYEARNPVQSTDA
jgi:hypothetical protein